MQSYQYTIEHRKGTLNAVPDALSRMYKEDVTPICSVGWANDTRDAGYIKMICKVQSQPLDHPLYKVYGEQLYHYRPGEDAPISMADDKAWKVVVLKENLKLV